MHTHFIRTISWNNFSKAKILILQSLEYKCSHKISKSSAYVTDIRGLCEHKYIPFALGCPKSFFRFISEIIDAQQFLFYIILWIYV